MTHMMRGRKRDSFTFLLKVFRVFARWFTILGYIHNFYLKDIHHIMIINLLSCLRGPSTCQRPFSVNNGTTLLVKIQYLWLYEMMLLVTQSRPRNAVRMVSMVLKQQTLVLAVNRLVGLEFYYTVPNYSQRSTKTHRARNQSKITNNNKKMWISIHIKVVSRVASQIVTKLQCKYYCLLLRFEKNLNQHVHQALDDLIYVHMPFPNYWN